MRYVIKTNDRLFRKWIFIKKFPLKLSQIIVILRENHSTYESLEKDCPVTRKPFNSRLSCAKKRGEMVLLPANQLTIQKNGVG